MCLVGDKLQGARESQETSLEAVTVVQGEMVVAYGGRVITMEKWVDPGYILAVGQ